MFTLSSFFPQIVHYKTMEEVKPHITRELYVKTLAPMMGYYKQQEKTNCMIDENGWIKTGICMSSYSSHARLDEALWHNCAF